MEARHKILLVDDDPDLLKTYSEILGQLPSCPEIHTATSAARGMALLEAHEFRLLIADLKMPKMDGLQMLSIVRRKYPGLRTVVLTALSDEQFRSRVYALGVDLYWQKPGTEREIRMFCECIESLLDRNAETGFRGVQSKGLVDIVQLECIAHSSSVLRITNGPLVGRIWINNGELVDAETDGADGEGAFQKILAWRTGSFETLPAEPTRSRKILKSYNVLLLESAQALDEAHGEPQPGETAEARPKGHPLAALSQIEGVEFVLACLGGEPGRIEALGLENPERFDAWARHTLERFRSIGERLQAGSLEQIEGLGPQRHVGLAQPQDSALCIGWRAVLTAKEVRERMKKATALWAS
jgi:CheY-like chemotaxis protein